jgi:hypothetical protein
MDDRVAGGCRRVQVRSALVANATPSMRHWRRMCVTHGLEVACAATSAEALETLRSQAIDVLLTLPDLTDGPCESLVSAAHRAARYPLTLVVAPNLDRRRAFQLGTLGVELIFEPLTTSILSGTLDRAQREAPDAAPWIVRSLGSRELPEMIAYVRTVAYRQGLRTARGCRREASRVLGVERQAIQNAVREQPELDFPLPKRA